MWEENKKREERGNNNEERRGNKRLNKKRERIQNKFPMKQSYQSHKIMDPGYNSQS